MFTVATVLKSGGRYTVDHVHRIRDQVGDQAHFVCLTDVHVDCIGIELNHNWPGWWSKIELFRGGMFIGPVVFLDLDTTVVGDLSELVRDRFTMLSDFYRPQNPASGVMAWHGDGPMRVYEAFKANPAAAMERHRHHNRLGDQAFIKDNLGYHPKRFGDEAVSFKVHCKESVPDRAVVVCYHGDPKPWDDGGCLPERL